MAGIRQFDRSGVAGKTAVMAGSVGIDINLDVDANNNAVMTANGQPVNIGGGDTPPTQTALETPFDNTATPELPTNVQGAIEGLHTKVSLGFLAIKTVPSGVSDTITQILEQGGRVSRIEVTLLQAIPLQQTRFSISPQGVIGNAPTTPTTTIGNGTVLTMYPYVTSATRQITLTSPLGTTIADLFMGMLPEPHIARGLTIGFRQTLVNVSGQQMGILTTRAINLSPDTSISPLPVAGTFNMDSRATLALTDTMCSIEIFFN